MGLCERVVVNDSFARLTEARARVLFNLLAVLRNVFNEVSFFRLLGFSFSDLFLATSGS